MMDGRRTGGRSAEMLVPGCGSESLGYNGDLRTPTNL
jgi:hypothetical protein